MDKVKDKLKGGESRDDNKTSDVAGDSNKHPEGFGERLKEDEHKFHEYNLKEEKMEADDNIWGQGPKGA